VGLLSRVFLQSYKIMVKAAQIDLKLGRVLRDTTSDIGTSLKCKTNHFRNFNLGFFVATQIF
jgi:hypothetical protein